MVVHGMYCVSYRSGKLGNITIRLYIISVWGETWIRAEPKQSRKLEEDSNQTRSHHNGKLRAQQAHKVSIYAAFHAAESDFKRRDVRSLLHLALSLPAIPTEGETLFWQSVEMAELLWHQSLTWQNCWQHLPTWQSCWHRMMFGQPRSNLFLTLRLLICKSSNDLETLPINFRLYLSTLPAKKMPNALRHSYK